MRARVIGSWGLAAALAVATPGGPAQAWALGQSNSTPSQSAVTQADIQRLQDASFDASSELSRLRSRDAAQAERFERELDDLRDEIVYLKVKINRSESVARSEYTSLRDKLDDLRQRIRGDRSSSASSPAPTSSSSSSSPSSSATTSAPASGSTTSEPVEASTTSTQRRSSHASGTHRHEIPVGKELDVRLQAPLTSETAQVEDRFEATTLVDLLVDDEVLIPAGSVMRGVVKSVTKAGRIERKGMLTLAFDEITTNGRTYPIRATVTQAIEAGGYKADAGKIGAGAGVGAIIGGILGGFKGAMAGILIGGGGTVAATEGQDVRLDAGTVLRVRFDSAVEVTAPRHDSAR